MDRPTAGSWTPWVVLAARLALAVVWLRAGLRGIGDPLDGVVAVAAHDALPTAAADLVATLVPVLQVVVALALTAGALTRGAASLSAALAVLLVVATGWVWVRGGVLDCGACLVGSGGVGTAASYPLELGRDVVLLALAVAVARRAPGRLALDGRRRTTTAGIPVEPEPAGRGSR